MAVKKTTSFDKQQEQTASLSKALGHPARIAILQILAGREDCICGDIADQLPLAQSTVSQHLKALKEAGIIKGKIDGVRTCYCLNEEGIEELQSLILPFIQSLTQNKNCC